MDRWFIPIIHNLKEIHDIVLEKVLTSNPPVNLPASSNGSTLGYCSCTSWFSGWFTVEAIIMTVIMTLFVNFVSI